MDKSRELNELIVQGRKEAYETERLRKLLETQVTWPGLAFSFSI